MNTKYKIAIDGLFGTPLAYIINLCARLLGHILRIDHSLDLPFKTIVVCKYAGLGSIIQATPLIQTLRKKYPHSKIIFVTMQSNAALVKHIPEINETYVISDKNLWTVLKSSIRLIRKMWRNRPGLYIDLEFYSNYSGIITTLCTSTNRFGFYNKDKGYRKGIYNYLVPFNIENPIAETYLQFARVLKCEEIITDLKIEVDTAAHKPAIDKKLGSLSATNYMVINPNASDLRLERRWPREFYVETIIYLLKKFPQLKIILIGNKFESAYVQEIESTIPSHPNLINSSGKLSLPELIVLIAGAKLMLTNDTGPMHIAFALNVKTISLFGPVSAQQYGKISNGITFYKKVHCSPCVHLHLIPPCKGDNICMKNIRPDEVKEALLKSLQ